MRLESKVTEIEKPFDLTPTAVVPTGTPLVTDDDPNRYWLLSNGRAWTLALGQNIRNVLPEVYAAPSGILFVGLYHGCTASVCADDGRIIDQAKLRMGNMVFWYDHGDFIIAGGELEVGVFEPSGQFLWKAGVGDVIEEIEYGNGVLKLTDSMGYTLSFEARTGRVV